MKNFTSILGWLLLIAVLSVPSFLFYNWWRKSKLQVSAELTNEPVSGSVFPSDKGGQSTAARQPLPAPVRNEPVKQPAPEQEASTAPAAMAQEPASAQDSPAETPLPPAASRPGAAPLVQQESADPAAQAAGSDAAQVESSTFTKPVSYYSPKSRRDPTFSPDDYSRIRNEQLQREEADRLQRMAENRRPPREPGPETRISLQGVVGNAAIINGDMYYVGQTVRGVKVLKIGADYIICDYKGKRFRKVLK